MRVVSWNLGYWTRGAGFNTRENRRWQWEHLQSLDADIVLVQECRPEDPSWVLGVTFELEYAVIGAIPHGWTACSAVIARRSLAPSPIERSGPWLDYLSGYLALATVNLPVIGPVLVASVHTPARPVDDPSVTEADHAKAKRPELEVAWHNDLAAACLAPLASGAGAFVIGGDWNTCRAFDDHLEFGVPSCAAWFDRRAEDGWHESLRRYWPDEQRTYLKRGTRPFELDHLFTNKALHRRLSDCRVQNEPPANDLSDHAPIVADFQL